MRSNKGNALFLILIAVALFAALSYAVTQSGRGGGTTSKENASLAASQATQFLSAVRMTATRMILTGTPATSLDFNSPATGVDAIFSSTGGGMAYPAVPSNIGNATDWGFVDVQGTTGEFIAGVGTNTTTTGREAFGGIADISLAACTAINKGLGLTGSAPAVNSAITGMSATYTVGTNVIDAYPGQPFGCMNPENDGFYVYYHAIVEQ